MASKRYFLFLFVVLTGCASPPAPQVEMTIAEGRVGIVDPGKRAPGGPVVILSKEDMKTLDSFWRDTTRDTLRDSRVPESVHDQTLRLLTVMIIGARRNMPTCAGFDLHGIVEIEVGTVPASILNKAHTQVPAPSIAETWLVKVCDEEEKWLVIGANSVPFIAAAPEGF